MAWRDENGFHTNEALIVHSKPARFVKSKTSDSGRVWVQYQFDNGEYDWALKENVERDVADE